MNPLEFTSMLKFFRNLNPRTLQACQEKTGNATYVDTAKSEAVRVCMQQQDFDGIISILEEIASPRFSADQVETIVHETGDEPSLFDKSEITLIYEQSREAKAVLSAWTALRDMMSEATHEQ